MLRFVDASRLDFGPLAYAGHSQAFSMGRRWPTTQAERSADDHDEFDLVAELLAAAVEPAIKALHIVGVGEDADSKGAPNTAPEMDWTGVDNARRRS